jgi:hypothetical protein
MMYVIGPGHDGPAALAGTWLDGTYTEVCPNVSRDAAGMHPAVRARIRDDELDALLRGYGYDPVYVSGDDPPAMHEKMAAALDGVIARIRAIQGAARGPAGMSDAEFDALFTPGHAAAADGRLDSRARHRAWTRARRGHARDHELEPGSAPRAAAGRVRAAADSGDPGAGAAIGVYLHRLRREIAAMAAALNGLDVLVFTGGVGEHDPAVRAGAAAGPGFLGVAVDEERNQAAAGERACPGGRLRGETAR